MSEHATDSANSPWNPPQAFEEYRLVCPLSRGAMGEVYLAHDTVLDRPVAIKFIIAMGVNGPSQEVREQFLTEARAAARLQHPNVVTIYRVSEIDKRPLIISEFIRGQNLDGVKKPIPWQKTLELGLGLARGLAAAHRRGVLHLDIKPGNVRAERAAAGIVPLARQLMSARRGLAAESGSRRGENLRPSL